MPDHEPSTGQCRFANPARGHWTLHTAVLCVLFALPFATMAQQAEHALVLEEVIVTAQKREQNLQDVPISVVALSGEQISRADLTTMEDLQTYVPNFYVTDTLLGPMLQIRGIGSGVNQGFEQSVGVYVDGVYYGRAQQSRMTLLDIERVEVLRGPQSILFGHNSISGAVNIATVRPTLEPEAGLSALYGSDIDEKKFTGYLSGPLGDSLAGRLSVHARDTDGYIQNLTLDRDDPAREERQLRGQLEWLPNDIFELRFKAELGSFETIGEQVEVIYDRPAAAGPFAGLNYAQVLLLLGQDPSVANNFQDGKRSANEEHLETDTSEFVLTANYHGWGELLLTSITAWNDYSLDELCDCDQLGANVFQAYFTEDHEQLSQELRLLSPGGQNLDWLAGAYFQANDLKFRDRAAIDAGSILVPVLNMQPGLGNAGDFIANTSAPRAFDQDTEVFALFGELDWQVADRLVLTAGARWSHETKHATRTLAVADFNGNPLPEATAPITTFLFAGVFRIIPHQLEGRRSQDAFMPSLKLQYDLGDSAMGYLSFAHGVKSGGFDTRSNSPPELGGSFEFDDEKANSWEVGAKTSFAGGAVDLNVAAYYTDYEDMQQSAFDGVLGFNVGNAAEAVAKGLELDGRWQVLQPLLLSASLALTDFEFKEYLGQCFFDRAPDAPDGINCDYRGQTNQYVADWSGVVGALYSLPLDSGLLFSASLDWLFSDGFLASSNLDPLQTQDAYNKFNARLALGGGDGRWELALIGKNLTDESIITISGDVPLAGSNFLMHNFSSFYEAPRTLALQLTLRH